MTTSENIYSKWKNMDEIMQESLENALSSPNITATIERFIDKRLEAMKKTNNDTVVIALQLENEKLKEENCKLKHEINILHSLLDHSE